MKTKAKETLAAGLRAEEEKCGSPRERSDVKVENATTPRENADIKMTNEEPCTDDDSRPPKQCAVGEERTTSPKYYVPIDEQLFPGDDIDVSAASSHKYQIQRAARKNPIPETAQREKRCKRM